MTNGNPRIDTQIIRSQSVSPVRAAAADPPVDGPRAARQSAIVSVNALRCAVLQALPSNREWRLVRAGQAVGPGLPVVPQDRFVAGEPPGATEVHLVPGERAVLLVVPRLRGALVFRSRIQVGPVDDGPTWWIDLADRLRALVEEPLSGRTGALLLLGRPELDGYRVAWTCPRCSTVATTGLAATCEPDAVACPACGCMVQLDVEVSATPAPLRVVH